MTRHAGANVPDAGSSIRSFARAGPVVHHRSPNALICVKSGGSTHVAYTEPMMSGWPSIASCQAS